MNIQEKLHATSNPMVLLIVYRGYHINHNVLTYHRGFHPAAGMRYTPSPGILPGPSGSCSVDKRVSPTGAVRWGC